jgi:hypothetical protein
VFAGFLGGESDVGEKRGLLQIDINPEVVIIGKLIKHFIGGYNKNTPI